ncbi:MAG TPA: hypothetical protein VHB98_24745 [Chloroflexota bacterium]|nr:hypothetical protein [Chloroflexota bacterium]
MRKQYRRLQEQITGILVPTPDEARIAADEARVRADEARAAADEARVAAETRARAAEAALEAALEAAARPICRRGVIRTEAGTWWGAAGGLAPTARIAYNGTWMDCSPVSGRSTRP